MVLVFSLGSSFRTPCLLHTTSCNSSHNAVHSSELNHRGAQWNSFPKSPCNVNPIWKGLYSWVLCNQFPWWSFITFTVPLVKLASFWLSWYLQLKKGAKYFFFFCCVLEAELRQHLNGINLLLHSLCFWICIQKNTKYLLQCH